MPQKDGLPDKLAPGAQPGDADPLKTGFYARCFLPGDSADLETHEFNGLEDELILLRVFLRRLLEEMKVVGTLQERIAILRAVSTASLGITRLLKVDAAVYGNPYTIRSLFGRITAGLIAEDEAKYGPIGYPQDVKEDNPAYHVDFEKEEEDECE